MTVYLETPDSGQIARAQHRLQIGWNAYSYGLISFDASTFDGADVFGISPLDLTFGGAYDDVSSLLRAARVSRGRNDNLSAMLSGDAAFDLRDPDGIFNPENAAGPLYGQLEDRLHPVKWEATTAGGTRGMFAGWTRRFVWEPGGRKGITRVECVDISYWLKRVKPIIASTGPTTTGAAIGLILDAAGLTDAALRDLDVGDVIPDFAADGTLDGLQLIEGLLDAERGVFYGAGTGKATFRSRLSRLTAASVATFDGRVRAIAPGVDFDSVQTRVTVIRTDMAGNDLYTVTAELTGSPMQKLGPVDANTIRTPYLASNTQADQLADWILSIVSSPTPPLYSYRIDSRDTDLLEQILDRDLVDRITAATPRGNTNGDYHIDNLTVTLAENGKMSADWLLSRASSITPGQFDISTFDSAEFVY